MAAIYSILSALSSVALARSPRLAPHRVTRIVACAIPPTSSPSEDAHGANAKRQRGRRRRSKPHDTSETPRRRITLQHAEDGLPPEIARCYPEQYDELLRGKVGRLEALLEDATPSADNLPPTEVFESERTHFRMRASFKIWREDEGLAYAMFNRDDARMPHEVLTYPMGSRRINELMTPLREALSSERVLKERINDLRFLTTTTGDALATVTYNKPIGAEWADAAERVADTLGMSLVGRSRKVKLVVGGGETVTECLRVPERGECIYTQTEGAFTQPNAGVCEKMLGWAYRATRDSGGGGGGGDLCELYCGNGCFTVALAPNFRRVVATEISKTSVTLAEGNLALNEQHNVRVAKLSAEEFAEAHAGTRTFSRLDDAGIELGRSGEYDFSTLFVDPPRAGLDEVCRTLARGFERVVYVSCNPETLARDVRSLAETHRVASVAAFDQFPYTPHLEAGVVLERR